MAADCMFLDCFECTLGGCLSDSFAISSAARRFQLVALLVAETSGIYDAKVAWPHLAKSNPNLLAGQVGTLKRLFALEMFVNF